MKKIAWSPRRAVQHKTAAFAILSFMMVTACAPKRKATLSESDPPTELPSAVDDGSYELVPETYSALLTELSAKGDLRVLVNLKNAQALHLIKAASRLYAAQTGLTIAKDFSHLPILSFRLQSSRELLALMSLPGLENIEIDRKLKRFTNEALPLIRQPETLAKGYDGAGTSVAVIDTGVDYTDQDLGSCSSPGLPANTCKVAYAQDFEVEDGLLDDADRHGTNVASIVSKVAPGSKILALDVFDGEFASTSTIVDAINWVIANKNIYKIAAMNLSLGGGRFSSPCPDDPMAVALEVARANGVLAAVAAGNEGYRNSLSAPACAPAAVSVGAVYDKSYGSQFWGSCIDFRSSADRLACFSNSASFLTVLAPGIAVSAGGVTLSGTSQASPQVAGAIAIMTTDFPSLSANARLDRLLSTGKALVDSRNSLTKPRIDLFAATQKSCSAQFSPQQLSLGATASQQSISLQTSPDCRWNLGELPGWISSQGPFSGFGSATIALNVSDLAYGQRQFTLKTGADLGAQLPIFQLGSSISLAGQIRIDNGASSTRSSTVRLSMQASDLSLLSAICISQASDCQNYQPFVSELAWNLSGSDGIKTLFLYFKDVSGQSSLVAQASILLDRGAPNSILVNLGSGAEFTAQKQVNLSISANDPSGIREMCISLNTVCNDWKAYAAESPVDFSAADGPVSVYIWLGDALGNRTTQPVSDSIILDTNAPIQRLFSGVALPRSFALTWSTAVDSVSGFSAYKLVYLQGADAPGESCANGAIAKISGTGPIILTGLGSRTNYSFRLCAIDRAGNISAGLVWKGRTI